MSAVRPPRTHPRAVRPWAYGGYRVALRLVRERPDAPRVVIGGAADVAALVRELADADRERFVSILLDTKRRVLGIDEVSVGTLDASLVHPRECFKAAILANAAGLIVAHNHPSGDPEPSPEDLALTRRLVGAGALLGVPVLDHLIIGAVGFVSLAERALL